MATWGPTDDRWYQPAGGVMTESGMHVDVDSAQKLSAWYRGRELLATVLAMLPLDILERLPNDGGSQKASQHPLYEVLHDKSNDADDAFQWKRQGVFDVIDHGWFYAWLVPGPRGFADKLPRIDPSLVTPRRQRVTMPNGGSYNGRYLFDVRDPHTGLTKTFTQDDIFYLRGAGGKGILEYARTSLGTALATESYAAQIFGRGALNGGIIETPGVLGAEAGKALAQSYVTKAGNWQMPIVLEEGAKWKPNEMSPEDFQMLLSRKFSVDDMARWLGVPRQMLENSDPSFGNAEQFDQNFITYSMGGWLSLFEFAINDQLILNSQRFFARFERKAFVRGKFSERVQGLVALKSAGIISADEARAVEDMNRRGGDADRLHEPQNVIGKPAAAAGGEASAPPAPPADGSKAARAEAIAVEAAARLLRKEISAISALAVRHAANEDDFVEAVAAFYVKHKALVAQTLRIDAKEAEGYCAGQCGQILAGPWYQALDLWKEPNYAAGVAAIALGEAA